MKHLMDKEVKVVIANRGTQDIVFNSKVVDYTENGVWVEHPELFGEDMLYIDITNTCNTVEVIEKEIEVKLYQDIKDIKKQLMKAIKWLDDVSISVKIYDCYENTISFDGSNDQTYDVEINYYVDGEYEGGFLNQTFVGRFQDDEVALKQATTRAKAVLRTVKGWFEGNEDVVVNNFIEVYHV